MDIMPGDATILDKTRLTAMLLAVAAVWQKNADFLSDIDSRFGDGDHGVTIGKIARLLVSECNNWGDKRLKDGIAEIGNKVMEIGGGSAGPLYGTLIGGLAEPLGEESAIDGPTLKKMFAASLEELHGLTKARQGDKTMMDALIPAVTAASAAEDTPYAVLTAAAEAAAAGAAATEQYIAKFGRAKNYGEQTLGAPDAGAVSTSLFFQGLLHGFG